jgi:hypothetical protein
MVILKAVSYTLILSILSISSSRNSEDTFCLDSLCPFKYQIGAICPDDIQSKVIHEFICSPTSQNCIYACSSSPQSNENLLFLISKENLSYHCSINSKSSQTLEIPFNLAYTISYFNCQMLLDLSISASLTLNLSDAPPRRAQTSCNIRLSLYSVFSIQIPTPSVPYILRVMNICNKDYSWLCKDSSSAYTIAFSNSYSASYLSAEYDVGVNKDSLVMEVYTLVSGNLRRECWGNKEFKGVPARSETSNIIYYLAYWDALSRFYTSSVSCRLTGFYKAKYTGYANVSISVLGSADAWIFTDSSDPNFPNLIDNQLYSKSVYMIAGEYYFIRIDSVYKLSLGLGIKSFTIAYSGVASSSVSMSDMYYPVRTDYSPLDIKSFSCDTEYFLPHPETNGDMVCFPDVLHCNTITYTKKSADPIYNPFCEKYTWENGVQIPQLCKPGGIVIDNICTCSAPYWQDYTNIECIKDSIAYYTGKLFKVISTQRKPDVRRRVMLAISNPCTLSETWTCKDSNVSHKLESSIYQLMANENEKYYNFGTLSWSSQYSYQSNILYSSLLHLACWNSDNCQGSPPYNQGQTFSSSYSYNPSYRSCRWEGFLNGLHGDISFIISGNSNASLWIKNDVTPIINYTCCNPASFNIRFAKELYFYFRLDISDPSNPLNISLKYKILPNGIEAEIPLTSMHQPVRTSIGLLTGTPSSTYINITNNLPDNDIFYCPLICTSCKYSYLTIECYSCIEGAYLDRTECKCLYTKYWDPDTANCEDCPPLCQNCFDSSNSAGCRDCIVNGKLDTYICDCNSGYFEDSNTNSCVLSSCPIEIIAFKEGTYTYADTILEISNLCKSGGGFYCKEVVSSYNMLKFRKQVSFTDLSTHLSVLYHISSNSDYTLSLLNLKTGSFILETYPSTDFTGTPTVSSTNLSINLNYITSGKSFRLLGYIKFSLSGFYAICIKTNTAAKARIEYQHEEITANICKHSVFVGNRYYYFYIEFAGIVSSPLNLKLTYQYDYLEYEFNPDKIYYPEGIISRWDISSCDSTIYTNSYVNGLRYCPKLCDGCSIRINRTTTQNNEICDRCVTNATVNLDGRCVCNGGYYAGSIDDECIRCPDHCKTCEDNDGVVTCTSCTDNAYLSSGDCICMSRYYTVTDSGFRCEECPQICTACVQLGSAVKCTSCIENAHFESDICICDTNYNPSTSIPIYCYKNSEYCTQTQESQGIISCTSCVINAHVNGNICTCNDGYYSSSSIENICLACPETCSKCKEELSNVICEECIDMHYLSSSYKGDCLRCMGYCNKCIEENGEAICSECFDTFKLSLNRCYCDSQDYFIVEDKCIPKPFTLNYESKYNIIFLYFSKMLYKELTTEDIEIVYPLELNPALISYSITNEQDGYSYQLEFEYTGEIDQIYTIEIIFSDSIIDRQSQQLNTTSISINLVLYSDIIEVYEHPCDVLCEECLDGGCIKCGDYAYLEDIRCRCYLGIDSGDICKPGCPEDMKIDQALKTCTPCDESCRTSNSPEIDNTVESDPDISKYSPEDIRQAELYSEMSSTVSTVATSGCLFLGFITLNLDSSWSLLNTIQIFIYLPLISVEMPLALQDSLKSQESHNKIVQYIQHHISEGPKPFKPALNYGFIASNFLYNSGKAIFMLSSALIVNTIVYLIHKYSNGKLKELSGKMLAIFCYGVYIRLFLQSYMDLAIFTLIQTLTVMYI